MNNSNFKKAADDLNVNPKEISWDRLETMLDNQQLSGENKIIKKKLRWITGIAASLLIVSSILLLNRGEETKEDQNLAYLLQDFEQIKAEKSNLYDLDKLAQLNDKYN